MESVNELRTRYPRSRKRKGRPLSADERFILRRDAARKQARRNLTNTSTVAAAVAPVVPAVGKFVAGKAIDLVYDGGKETARALARAASTPTPPPSAPSPVPPSGPSPVVHHHYHHQALSERTVSSLLGDAASGAARDIGSHLLSGVLVGSATAGALAAKKRTRRIEPRPAEARGGDPVAPRPGTDDGQLPAGADEVTRPVPPRANYQAQLKLFFERFDELQATKQDNA